MSASLTYQISGEVFAMASRDMKQFNLVATACIGGIALAFAFAVDFYPVFATAAYLGALAYAGFAPDWKKPPPPAEPWYMK
jgi:hypothetical protein